MNSHYNTILRTVISSLKKHTELEDIDIFSSFSSLGITSLLSVRLISDINNDLKSNLKAHDIFLYPTPDTLTNYLLASLSHSDTHGKLELSDHKKYNNHEPIAIIAMDCKYPGADGCEAFWENCSLNKESISFFDKNDASNSSEHHGSHDVYARGMLNDIEFFDAQFFNYTPKEAHLSDPQHRLFIESAWRALEAAGYASEDKAHGKVGVYASMNDSTYMLDQHVLERSQANLTDRFALQRAMSSQFLATKVAYLLNCTGPSITVQTACSSSLVATVLACQQLASSECDMAIAGGVSIVTPQDRPYVYQQENIYSPDGHCRPFDAGANGTVFSNGLGVVVLKRLSDAIRDRDLIVSVIKGYSLNNDGMNKMSYAAPSMQGQMDCILSAQAMAKVETDSIQYVEAHGTGTLIGDPIEIEALTKVFRQSTSKKQFCAIGSVKANIGHTHVAAGIAGLIKASLALKHQKLPPALHFKTPNPDIDFMHSPFYVNTRLLHWRKTSSPRRAAVSAFGVGGTNAHVILEEAPTLASCPAKRETYSLLLSAKTEKALQAYHDKLIHFVENLNPDLNTPAELANLAYTLQVGRNHYPYRSGIVCDNFSDALNQLKTQKNRLQQGTIEKTSKKKRIVFLFPGQGAQSINMSYGLYKSEPVFRQWLDKCLDIASQSLKFEIRDVLFPEDKNSSVAQEEIFQTQYAHPILFSVEFSLAKLLEDWGITADVMLGHSLGEYVAACLADVFSLEDAMHIVCARGNAISLCDEGRMLSVPLPQKELQPFCENDVDVAVETAPNLCVLSSSISGIQTVHEKIAKAYSTQPLSIKELKNTRPFHSGLLAKAVKPLLDTLKSVSKNSPKLPYLSNLTGDWIKEEEVLSDQYWIDHMLKTVQLSKSIEKLLDDTENTVFIEVGPGRTLLTSLQMNAKGVLNTISTLSKDDRAMAVALKDLWCYGCTVDWKQFYRHENRNRIPLPTYPFQKQRFWVDQIYPNQHQSLETVESNTDLAFYTPTWACDPKNISDVPPVLESQTKRRWIVFANQSEICKKTCQILLSKGEEVVTIFQENGVPNGDSADYILNIKSKSDYDHAFEKIISTEIAHYAIAHFWGTESTLECDEDNLLEEAALYKGLYSGIFISQALNQFASDAVISWAMVTTDVHSILGNEVIDPLKSGVLSLCRVLPLENPADKLYFVHFDVDKITNSDMVCCYSSEILSRISSNFSENGNKDTSNIIAFRNKKIWLPTYSQVDSSDSKSSHEISFVNSAIYLITGGLGGMGLTMAQWLSDQSSNATIILLSRSAFPKRNDWKAWLADHASDNLTSEKIRLLQKMISQGSTVEVLQADVADYNRMKEVVSFIERQFGLVHGIFHLAGVSGKGLVALKKMNEVHKVLSPKVQGLQVLIRLFQDKKLEFFTASSSLTAIVGGVGQIDYCAANIYLDYCLENNPFKYCKRILTLNWNSWRSIGMAANVGQATHCRLYAGNSITPLQGALTLGQLLTTLYNQVIVSRYSPAQEVMRIKKTFECTQIQNSAHPQTENKQQDISNVVKLAWERTLGITNISDESSIHEHGGDSLTLIQLIAIFEKELGVKVVLQELTQCPTISKMASYVKGLVESVKE